MGHSIFFVLVGDRGVSEEAPGEAEASHGLDFALRGSNSVALVDPICDVVIFVAAAVLGYYLGLDGTYFFGASPINIVILRFLFFLNGELLSLLGQRLTGFY